MASKHDHDFPENVHVSQHPCLRAKLSQLRSHRASNRETNALVHQISSILACEALSSSLEVTKSGIDITPLGYEYTTESVSPEKLALIPILRSGLGMIQAIQEVLPSAIPVHHLGLFRETTTLEPVEYYNKLPFQPASATTFGDKSSGTNAAAAKVAILLDPIVATGGTSIAAIQTLREWGVERVLFLCILGTEAGLKRAAAEWREGVEIWVGGVDPKLDKNGMIAPGLGDIGDRLFLAMGSTHH